MCNSALIFVLLCGISYGFVLTSSTHAESGESRFLKPGKIWVYEYEAKTDLNGKGQEKNHVGFKIRSSVTVESVWKSDDKGSSRVLKFHVYSPKVFTKSKNDNEYTLQSNTNLETFQNEDFYVLWKNGVIDRILIRKEEELPLVNLKKGIASLFQIQFEEKITKEQDSSGICEVNYKFLGENVFEKTKLKCENFDLSRVSNVQPILSTKIDSKFLSKYQFDANKEQIESVDSEEHHLIYLSAKNEIGSEIFVRQNLNLKETADCENCIMNEETYKEIKQKLTDDFGVFKEEDLLTHKDFSKVIKERSLSNIVGEFRDSLKAKNLGKLVSAKAIIPLINYVRNSNKEEIMKVLNLKKNQKILPQLYDILGFAQSENTHEVVMKKLHFDDPKNEDNNERYLWACQLSSNPNPTIILDLLNKFKKTENIPKKIQETLILSISSMASTLSNLNKLGHKKVVGIVQETILNNLDVANDEDKIVYLRALGNLKSPSTIPKLVEIISDKKTNFKNEVSAWKALKAMDPSSLNDLVLKTAYKTYFQKDKKHDSSSRTLAADILLESNPKDKILEDLLNYLIVEDKEFEVKKYVLQQIEMKAQEDESFKLRVTNIIKNNTKINNYSGLAPRGLSLALSRKFMSSESSNGSLLTIQEMSNGIVKRGIVNVMMDKNGYHQELASLGIFSGGLGSFMSSDSSDSEESTTAGMELSLLGSQIRPFVFFESQGELMGHVWSGTASERTTAFQALILVQDHEEYLRLGPGFIVDIDFKGGASFDLAGNIEMSLWNRNAQTLIEKSVGYVGIGITNLDTTFANLRVEYKITVEPKLSLNADTDFSSNVALCMRLSQPDSVFTHSLLRKQSIPKSNTLSAKKITKVPNPGRTYALNAKNDGMCSNMFKE